MILFALLIVLAGVLIKFEINRRRLSYSLRNISGLKEYPFLGNVLSLKEFSIENFEACTQKIFPASVTKFFIFDQLALIVQDPIVLEEILMSSVFSKRPFNFAFLEAESSLFTTNCKKPKLSFLTKKKLKNTILQIIIGNHFVNKLIQHLANVQYNN